MPGASGKIANDAKASSAQADVVVGLERFAMGPGERHVPATPAAAPLRRSRSRPGQRPVPARRRVDGHQSVGAVVSDAGNLRQGLSYASTGVPRGVRNRRAPEVPVESELGDVEFANPRTARFSAVNCQSVPLLLGTSQSRGAGGPLELEVLTPDELCALLKIKKSWLYDQVEAGAIPYVKLGSQLRVQHAAIAEYLRAHSNVPSQLTDET